MSHPGNAAAAMNMWYSRALQLFIMEPTIDRGISL